MDGVEAWSRNFGRFGKSCAATDAELCDGVHLCQPCCDWVLDKYNTSTGSAALEHPTRAEIEQGKEFVCKHLGPIGSNGLANKLTTLPTEEGEL